jgi:hypothetical protein
LSVIFCHSNQKVALLGQKAKSPQKLFCLLFKNCTYQLNSAELADIRAYDKAKAKKEIPILLSEAIQQRRKKAKA